MHWFLEKEIFNKIFQQEEDNKKDNLGTSKSSLIN